MLVGLRVLGREFPAVESIGIDTWGVDYALLDADGNLLAEPVSYRDDRTTRSSTRSTVSSPRSSSPSTDCSSCPSPPSTNSRPSSWSAVERAAAVVLLPDLLAYWLTGELGTERTNASTTGLLDARTGTWSGKILRAVGVPTDMFPPLQQRGEHPRPALRERSRKNRAQHVRDGRHRGVA